MSAQNVGDPTVCRGAETAERWNGTVLDLLLPSTDAGVALQAAIVTIGAGIAFALSQRRSDARLIVWGITLCAFAFMGARALH